MYVFNFHARLNPEDINDSSFAEKYPDGSMRASIVIIIVRPKLHLLFFGWLGRLYKQRSY